MPIPSATRSPIHLPIELAERLDCNLTEPQLDLCIRLIESGKVDSTALALLVAELQRALPPANKH